MKATGDGATSGAGRRGDGAGPTAIRIVFASAAARPDGPEWQARVRLPPETRATLAARVGANVRRMRRRLGLSQRQLARAVGCDASTICRYEAGERLPHVPALLALGAALGCEPAALVGGSRTED